MIFALALLMGQTKQQPVPFASITKPVYVSTREAFYAVSQVREGKGGGVRVVFAVTYADKPDASLNGNAEKVFEDTSKHTLMVLGRAQRADEAGKRVHSVKLLFERVGTEHCGVKTWIDGKLFAAK